MAEKNCRACAHCYMEPSDMNFVCGHPDSGTFGLYLHRGTPEHCGPGLTKFEQHPRRTPEGNLQAVVDPPAQD